MDERDALRALPSVERLINTEPLRSAAALHPHALVVQAARGALEDVRKAITAGNGGQPQPGAIALRAARALERAARASLGPVINATGVVLHTNLGRAPLAPAALDAIDAAASGYSNLEYDVVQGERGSRQAHVEALICELTGADAAVAVNNNAAAVMLTLAALAPGREVVISRGQLVEIGGSFRIPEILAASGAHLVEVGTTNRTRIADYERAIGPDTAVLLRVHPSNFRTVGFTEEASLDELCELARRHASTVVDDLGSGVLAHQGRPWLEDEPAARASIAAGADVVCFSADKLLGGPQAGIAAGSAAAIARMRAHPLARAVRIDKLSLAALAATLALHREPDRAARELPVLRMLAAPAAELAMRAERLRAAIESAAPDAEIGVVRASARAGGGSLPMLELEGPVVRVASRRIAAHELHARLRGGDPPVVARVSEGAVLLDPRTIADVEVDFAARVVCAALSR